MGMYDNVKYECVCPVCHNKVDDFQSKSGECLLDTLEPYDVANFYSACNTCGCWLEFYKQENGKYLRRLLGKEHEELYEYGKEINI